MLNIIMFATMLPTLVIVFLILYFQNELKKTYYFGASVSKELRKEEELQQINKQYKRQMWLFLMLLVYASLGTILIHSESLQYTYWMVWFVVMFILMFTPYIKANRAVKNYKQKNGLYDNLAKTSYVEEAFDVKIRQVNVLAFLCPIVLSVLSGSIAVINCTDHMRSAIINCTVEYVLCSVIIFVIAIFMDRTKVEMISTNNDVNQNYAKAKKCLWKNYWLVLCWGNTFVIGAATVAELCNHKFFFYSIVGMIVEIIIFIILTFLLLLQVSKLEQNYSEQRNLYNATEDDRCWLGGMIYYNPKDEHVMVNKRNGIGTTINMASKTGKIFTYITILVMLCIPASCVMMMVVEWTPVGISVTEDTLEVKQVFTDYKISVSDIDSIKMVSKLPKRNRIHGTGMKNLEKGTYSVNREGECELLVKPLLSHFIKIKADGTCYYFSGNDEQETKRVYDSLTKRMEE